jgi:hypothetical protein
MPARTPPRRTLPEAWGKLQPDALNAKVEGAGRPPVQRGCPCRPGRGFQPSIEVHMLYVDLFESQAIAMFAYDLEASSLLIRFKSGDVYVYRAVPRAVFDGFRAAPSKGQYFQSAIRDRFAARRLSASEAAAIERLHARGAACAIADIVRVDMAALDRPWKAGIFF